MAVYNLLLKPSVEKDLQKIPAGVLRLVFKKIEQLSENPLPAQSVKLSGAENLFRVRAGDYRIIYEPDHTARQLTIHYVRHRRDVYRNL